MQKSAYHTVSLPDILLISFSSRTSTGIYFCGASVLEAQWGVEKRNGSFGLTNGFHFAYLQQGHVIERRAFEPLEADAYGL